MGEFHGVVYSRWSRALFSAPSTTLYLGMPGHRCLRHRKLSNVCGSSTTRSVGAAAAVLVGRRPGQGWVVSVSVLPYWSAETFAAAVARFVRLWRCLDASCSPQLWLAAALITVARVGLAKQSPPSTSSGMSFTCAGTKTTRTAAMTWRIGSCRWALSSLRCCSFLQRFCLCPFLCRCLQPGRQSGQRAPLCGGRGIAETRALVGTEPFPCG